MGYMSDLDIERGDALSAAQNEYIEAYDVMIAYQRAHDINHRKLIETQELARLESHCMSAKRRYEDAKADRYRVTI